MLGLDEAQLLWLLGGLVIGIFVFGVHKKG